MSRATYQVSEQCTRNVRSAGLQTIGAGSLPGPTLARGIVERRALFERLAGAARVTQLSALAGSGKTFLLRSWIKAPALARNAACITVSQDARDPKLLLPLLVEALRGTAESSSRHVTKCRWVCTACTWCLRGPAHEGEPRGQIRASSYKNLTRQVVTIIERVCSSAPRRLSPVSKSVQLSFRQVGKYA